ncbi:MAG: EAL domain-containing protein [Lachnospiraceae bacterium]|nr:EAL domain-containing protein [Lachnospiraceae bacterium]
MKRYLLNVEDNEINRTILTEILSEEYHVIEAENGQEALEKLREHQKKISLILLDVQMPVMDGYTFLDRMKEDEGLDSIPVIVMTQGNSEEDELAALEHGATDFLPKPYRPRIILHRVAGLIKLRETAAIVNQLQYDRMTGLFTKEYFYQIVREHLLQKPDQEFCIVCSNIEHFKLYNDIFGVQRGDELLKRLAELTRKMAGEDGFAARLSGDRFLCFLPRCKAERAKEFLEKEYDGKTQEYLKNVALRLGIYEIQDPGMSVELMCDRALLAADSVKGQYNRHYAVYDESLRDKLLRERAITAAMDQALQEEQFVIYYQPKYSLKEHRLSGAEALVRWIHPEWGFMSPGEFIPLFEKNGFIPRLDLYVREKVCAQLRRWMDEGYDVVPVSVNISRADIFQEDLAVTIHELVESYAIPPRLLHLEITESAYADNQDQIVSTVGRLRERGFVIEMDDFGSGYSSLNMLSQMSLDILKLDMKFTQNEIAKPVKRSFLENVISMAHQVDMTVVAEGVETDSQAERLEEAGCDYAQGYYLARPMPAEEFVKLLTKTVD